MSDKFLKILELLGKPHTKLPPIIHVAGTNGKGSTIAFLRAILEGEGPTTHVYTSPHLIRVTERIVVAGHPLSDEKLANYRHQIKEIGIDLTFFEEVTAIAFLAFSETPADFCLLEVGLGGRLDATNVVHPAVSIITSISYDHQAQLGQTLREIAQEKAGIIKPGIPVICAFQKNPEVLEVISQQATYLQAPLRGAPSLSKDIPLGLLGDYQYDNAAAALVAAQVLLPNSDPQRLSLHLKNAHWPGRLQKLSPQLTSQDIWVDGAHNQDGILALAAEVQKWKREGMRVIVGASQLADRSEDLLMPLFDLADEVYHIDMGEDKFRGKFSRAKKSIPVKEALSYFGQPAYNTTRILLTGSLYMVGKVMEAG
jgi:dihydrofolate synthase / folylpolyglutamate synthase